MRVAGLALSILLVSLPLTALAEDVSGTEGIGSCFAVQKTQLLLKSSRLRHTYQAYKFNIQNNCQYPIDVVNANAASATSGLVAYKMIEKSSAVVWGSTLGGGSLLSIPTLGLSLLGALIAWPIIGGVNVSKNHHAYKESIKFTDQVPVGLMNAGESNEMLTLVPLGQHPQLKFTLKRQNDTTLYSISR